MTRAAFVQSASSLTNMYDETLRMCMFLCTVHQSRRSVGQIITLSSHRLFVVWSSLLYLLLYNKVIKWEALYLRCDERREKKN